MGRNAEGCRRSCWRLWRAPALIAIPAVGLSACGRTPLPGEGPLKLAACFGEVGVSPGQFSYPRAMDHDGDSLWVIDKTARVQHLDASTGKYLGGWKMPEFLLGKPVGVTIGPGDGGERLVYVPDTHYHRVMVYRPGKESGAQPEVVAEIGSFGEAPGQFIYPTDIAVWVEPGATSPSRLYISEYGGNDRINVFEHDTAANSWRYSFSFGSFGESASPENVQFKRPQSIAIDVSRRELIVADACNHRVGRISLEGKLIAWIGTEAPNNASPGESAPSAPGANATAPRFLYPYGLCLREDGTALVSEFGAARVHWVDLEKGRSLGTFGVMGREPGELVNPWAVTTIGERVFVLDSGNNRIEAFDLALRSPHLARSASALGAEGPR